jgi:uncharacterized protein YdcH (DUF465 family)
MKDSASIAALRARLDANDAAIRSLQVDRNVIDHRIRDLEADTADVKRQIDIALRREKGRKRR